MESTDRLEEESLSICISDMLYAISYALDCVEHDLIGVTTHHSKRVAYISVLMGEYFGLSEKHLLDLASCAILHDNALTEYIQEEYRNGNDVLQDRTIINVGHHCSMGEENLKKLPFFGDVNGAVLYHHENADGSGPFHMKQEDTPLYAEIIHLADQIDCEFDLSFINREKYENLLLFLRESKGSLFSELMVNVFEKRIDYEYLSLAKNARIDVLLRERLPVIKVRLSNQQTTALGTMFANIIDYKSQFTREHSLGIAKKASQLGEYYGFSEEMQAKLFLAGALHDIGKLVVDKDVLEKPAKLTEQEYKHIQNHAYFTYDMLRRVKGLEEITVWASNHHEKLNGKGYPFGKEAKELGFPERLMACLDIYQALTEPRPYKQGMKHEYAMNILHEMARDNSIDAEIVEDIDKLFGNK